MTPSSSGTGVGDALVAEELLFDVLFGEAVGDDEFFGDGLETVFPFESTVFVVPSVEVTVEVDVFGVGVGAAKEISGVSEINAVMSKESNLFFFIIVSLPPL